ncbi:hypothetical protein MN116_004271 [Schistosoma mekongi]|uniref:Uncharacterized protein n=1 Tax=Schistosoma mekongi TaxID=38744 RepID=A0AAE2D6E2_SCHME|nr:hypothetical protein MN116_004271 [Schistosoma mekongi]
MSSVMGVSALVSHDPNPYFSGLLRHHSSDCVTEGVSYRETPYNSFNAPSAVDVSHSPLVSHSSKDPLPTCTGCRRNITDQYLYRIRGLAWHESCAICSVCSVELVEVCFIVNKNELLCRRDYDRLYAIKCANCRQPMRSHELFMRARHSTSVRNPPDVTLMSSSQELIFHVSCFTCCICQQPIAAGEAYVIDPISCRPICHSDFLTKRQQNQQSPLSHVSRHQYHSSTFSSNTNLYPVRTTNNCQSSDTNSSTSSSPRNWRQTDGNSEHIHRQSSSNCCLSNKQNECDDDIELTYRKTDWPVTTNQDLEQSYQSFSSGGFNLSRRIRTSLTDEQRYRLQEAYELNIRPPKSMRQTLASELGVPMRVVQVWFQNQRARDKRASVYGRLQSNPDKLSVPHMNMTNPSQLDRHQLHFHGQQSPHHYNEQQSSDLCPFTPSPHTSVESGPFPEFGGFSSENLVRYVPDGTHNDPTDVQPWRSVSHAVWLVENTNGHSTVR